MSSGSHRRVGASKDVALSVVLATVGGIAGVVFVGLSTVVMQSVASDAVQARVTAIWAAAFVGLLPLGGLITAGLPALLGSGGAVVVDALVMLAGGIVVILRRAEIAWLGARRCRRPALRGRTRRLLRWSAPASRQRRRSASRCRQADEHELRHPTAASPSQNRSS
jgi:hypothetical protein